MLKLSSELLIHNTYIEFDNPAGKTFAVAPAGKVRMHSNQAGTAFLQSVSGGAYQSSGGGEQTFATDGEYQIGRGLPLGQPPGIITLAEGIAGALTGAYLYKYTETDTAGQTIGSASATITVSAKKINVTVPLPRRGVSTRNLWRTAAGGSTYFLLAEFGAGDGSHQTGYVDNIADGSLGAATIPTTDTTALFEFELAAGVKYFRTHPDQLTAAADVTFHTGDPATAGAYGIDNYGSYFGRVAVGSALGLHVTGNDANAIQTLWVGDTFDAVAAVVPFQVDGHGKTRIIVAQPLTDAEPSALHVQATMPATQTDTRSGVIIDITSAGASAQQQNALAVSFQSGYTGNQAVNGLSAISNVATTATNAGLRGQSLAGARSVGVIGRATGGTNNIGAFGGLNIDPDTLTGISGAGIFSNGDQAQRILGLYDNTDLAFEVQNSGYILARGIGTDSFATGVNDSTLNLGGPLGGNLNRGTPGSGGAQLRATGAGNNVFFGHSNTEFLSTLGANSGSGVPFVGFYAYHGPTSSTQRYASGTNIPTKLQASTAGFFSIENAVAGTVNTDITWLTRLKVGPNGRLFCGAPATAPTDSEIGTSQITFYVDEAGASLKIRIRQSDGTTLKLASIALV